MQESLVQSYEAAQKKGGYFDLTSWGVVRISGQEACDFLHRLSTISFKNINYPRTQAGALLTGKAGVVSIGFFESKSPIEHYFVTSNPKPAAAHLEGVHFSEDLEIAFEPRYSVCAFYNTGVLQKRAFPYWIDPKIENLSWTRFPYDEADWLSFTDLPLLDDSLYEYLRIRAEVPRVGVELSEKSILLEAPTEWLLDREKGCYPGQEVIERIYTYGQVNWKILPFALDRLPKDGAPLEIRDGEECVGQLLSVAANPAQIPQAIALGRVKKAFWDAKSLFTDTDPPINIKRIDDHA